jgi:cell wall-associated NlpC family hydrolase
MSSSLVRKRFLCIILFLSLVSLAACAPKKVRLYEMPSALRGGVVQTALSLQGKPYKSGAKGPDFFDCSGLVYYTYKQSRVPMPITAEAQSGAGYEVARGGVQPGDLVLFRIDTDLHVGIMISGSEFVHASKSRGVTVDSVDSRYWRKRLIGYRAVL